MKKFLVGLIALIAVGTAWYALTTTNDVPEAEFVLTPIEVTFSKAGVVVQDNPGYEPGVPFLIYEEPGAPALTKKLLFIGESFCASRTGGLPCLAMSHAPFIDVYLNNRVIVEGVLDGDAVSVLAIRLVPEGETGIAPQPGSLFISWSQAVTLLERCDVESVMQAHSLDVYFDLRDGRRVRAIEPVIDEVFRVTERTEAVCGSLRMATE
jgi:hypothetical protein